MTPANPWRECEVGWEGDLLFLNWGSGSNRCRRVSPEEHPDWLESGLAAVYRGMDDLEAGVSAHDINCDGAIRRYYRKRAHEYERIYDKPERQADLLRLQDHLRRMLGGHRVLELACGTGYWTTAIADAAESVVAIDFNDEVLEIARSKGLDPARVSFARGDAYHSAPDGRDFSAGLAAFWWSHVPRARLALFLEKFHAALLPGARVVFADNRFVAGSSTPISRTDEDGNTYQLRRLDDGSTHEVLKNFPSGGMLREAVQAYATAVEVTELEYFWCLSYEVHAPV